MKPRQSPALKAIGTLDRVIASRHQTLRLRLFQQGRHSQLAWLEQEPDYLRPGDGSKMFAWGVEVWRNRQSLTSLSAIDFAVSIARTGIVTMARAAPRSGRTLAMLEL